MADATTERPAIHVTLAGVSAPGLYRWVEVGAEEEGVPTRYVDLAVGDVTAAAFAAAQSSRFGIGVAVGQGRVVLHEAHMPPERPVLSFELGPDGRAPCRVMGGNAARLVVRLPLRLADELPQHDGPEIGEIGPGHPQMPPIAGPFPPQVSCWQTEARRCEECRPATGRGTPTEGMARQSAASVDSRNGLDEPGSNSLGPSTTSLLPTETGEIGPDHPQMPPIAGPFPPRLCCWQTEARRCEECRPATGRGTPTEGMARQSAASVDSRNGLDEPHSNSLGPSTTSLLPTETCENGPDHPQMPPIAGPFPPRVSCWQTEARRREECRAATGRGTPTEGMARQSAASVDSRNGLDEPHSNSLGPSATSLLPTETCEICGQPVPCDGDCRAEIVRVARLVARILRERGVA
jgi:hypothetical protein